ncbi:PaaI family thioesterase [Microvirga sp. CF3062]|uniref:PaaI family thioesterase n=1 Tax=Microvirga sp. CF3062 TaxID=3110182 RepID=UPI002E76FD34|nr:PaaI family thioesterase [Microvirga sp. CF3062]MEE1656060.1 PaaI family thioesterase [Microvirga sp. CF3062]
MDTIPFDIRAAGIRERVALQGFMHLVGAQIDELAPGSSTISVTRRDDLLQQHGLFHGGVTAFLIDNGTTIAAATVLKPGQGVLTAEYKLNLFSPADGSRLICRSRVVKPGSRMIIVAADVFTEKDGREKQTAVALATIAVLDQASMPPLRETGQVASGR